MPFNIRELSNRMLSDPEFQKLPYYQQLQVRAQVLANKLEQEPDYAAADPGTKQAVYEQLAQKFVSDSVPAFEDFSFYNLMGKDAKARTGIEAFLSRSLLSMGVAGVYTQADRLAKLVGFVPKDAPDIWNTMYSRDKVKLSQYIAAKRFKDPNALEKLAGVGEIADYMGLSALGGMIGGGVKALLGGGAKSAIAAGRLAAGAVTETGFRGAVLRSAARATAMGETPGLIGGLFSGEGMGPARTLNALITKAAQGNATGALGKAVGKWVVNGSTSKLLSMGAREWLLTNALEQVVRSVGAGVGMVAHDVLLKKAAPDVPWAPGIETTAQDVAKSFGRGAAYDYLFNMAFTQILPFVKLVGRSLGIGPKLETSSSLREFARWPESKKTEFVRRIKLGSVDEAVWKTLDQTTQDHLIARANFETVVANGAEAVFRDPVQTIKTLGFLTNVDVVDAPLAPKAKDLPKWMQDHLQAGKLATTDRIFTPAELRDPSLVARISSDPGLSQAAKDSLLKSGFLPQEGGFFRMRVAPGTTVRQILNGEYHDLAGGTVLHESARLPEANAVLAERFKTQSDDLFRRIEGNMKRLDRVQRQISELEGSEEVGDLEKLAELKTAENSIKQKLQGNQITLQAYQSYEPMLGGLVQSIDNADAAFVVDTVEGAKPAFERSMISYAEAAAAQQKSNVRTMRFLVDLPKEKLSGKEARVYVEKGEAHQVRDVKDFFVRQHEPFRVSPAEGNFNGLLAYSNPAPEALSEYLKKEFARGGSSLSSPEELAQAVLLHAGYDSILHQNGDITALLPRKQIKHVTDMLDVRKGTYRAGIDVNRPAAKERTAPGLNPHFLSSLGKENQIKLSLGLHISNQQLMASERAMVTLLKTVYGDVNTGVVKKVAQLYMMKHGIDAKNLEVRVGRGVKPQGVTLSAEGDKKILLVPSKISTVAEQYKFIDAIGEALSSAKKEDIILHGGKRELARGATAQGLLMSDVIGPKGEIKASKQVLDELELGKQEIQKGFEEGIARAIQEAPGLGVEAGKVARKNIYASPLEGVSEKEKILWLEAAAMEASGDRFVGIDKRFPNEKKYTIQFKDGSEFSSSSVDDLIDEFLVRNTSEQMLRYELFEASGYQLKKTASGYEVWDPQTKSKDPLYRSQSIPDLLHEMNFRAERIDSVFAPTTVEIGTEGVTFKMTGKYMIGNINQARKVLDRFVDPAREMTKKIVKRTAIGKLSQHVDQHWEVEIPGWGIRKDFHGEDAAREASEFFNGRYQTYSEIQKLANERGMQLRFQDGKYKLYDETGTYWAKNKDEVGAILSRNPDPSFLPNLVPEVDEATLLKAAQDWRAAFAPGFWTIPQDKYLKKTMGLTNVSQTITPLESWMETFARKTGHTALVERFNAVTQARREALKQANDARRLFLYNLSDSVPGKLKKTKETFHLFPEDKLIGMKHYMEQTTKEGKELVAKEFSLEKKHIDATEKIRDLLGSDPLRNPGLFGKIGVDSNLFLFEYMPRYRESAARLGYGPDKVTDADLERITLDMFGEKSNVPKTWTFASENERVQDLLLLAQEDNLASLLQRYSDRMHLKMFLNEPWKRLADYIDNAPAGIGKTAKDAMDRYRELVMGVYDDKIGKWVAAMGRDMAVRLNKTGNKLRKLTGRAEKALSPTAGMNLADMLFTANTLTTQGYRVWLTGRNCLQVYTTGAALLNNRWLDEGIRIVNADPQETARIMIARGSVTEAPPLLNPIASGESWLTKKMGRLTEVGMSGIQRSDTLTRGVMYFGAEAKWDHYWKFKDKSAAFNFENAIQLGLLRDVKAAQVRAFLKEGTPSSIAAARHIYADEIQRLTMFDYDRAVSPRAFHGFIGRAFGQYQVYPAYYIALLKHLATHGSASERIGNLLKLGLNAGAVAGSLALMGLDGRNALPWVPASIGAGPMFTLAWNLMQSTNTTSYKGSAARGELLGMMKTLVPGSYELKMLTDFIKYMDAGKPLLALYALTSAPIRPDLRIK